MTYFEYSRIGDVLRTDILSSVRRGESIALLGPPYSGKQYLMAKLATELGLNEHQLPLLHLHCSWAEPIRTTDELSQRLYRVAGLAAPHSTGDSPLAAIDALNEKTGRTVILLVSSVDNMPHYVARAFLTGLQKRADERRVVAVLGGEFDFTPLVHGPTSAFNCARQIMLQGCELEEFRAALRQYPSVRCDDENVVAQYLCRETGGSLYLLRLVMSIALANADTLTVANLEPILYSQGLPSVYWEFLLKHANRIVAQASDSLSLLEELLLSGNVPTTRVGGAPSVLEFASIAVRDDKRLTFSSPLMERFAQQHYGPRQLADLYASAGHWGRAFEYYSRIELEQKLRPSDTHDHVDLTSLIRSLSAALHSEVSEGADRVRALFENGCRHVLGFTEVLFWTFQTSWKCHSSDSVQATVINELKGYLPNFPSHQQGPLNLSRHASFWVLGITLPAPHPEHPVAVTLSNLDDRVVIAPARRALAEDLLKHFRETYARAIDVEQANKRLKVRECYLRFLGAILEGLGTKVHDVKHVLRLAATELRTLGYRRVMFSLVDARREWIRGVWDDPGKPVDLARLTRYRLDRPTADLQPYVVSTGRSFLISDARTEPLANPEAVNGADLTTFAVVPILNKNGRTVGTIHIERERNEAILTEELNDLERFGRHLATVLGQIERVTLQHNSLDEVPEPILIVDSRKRVRYANRPLELLLGIPSGWRDSGAEDTFSEPSLDALIENALTDQRVVRQMRGLGRRDDYQAMVLCQSIREHAIDDTLGVVVHIEDQNYLHLVFDAIRQIGESHDMEDLKDNLLRAVKILGHERARLYLIDPDDPNLLRSSRAIGLRDPDNERRFDAGEIVLAAEGSEEYSWRAIQRKRPILFSWQPERQNEETLRTRFNLSVTCLREPARAIELEKRPDDYWIDLPLTDPLGGRPLGKMALQCCPDLRPEHFEMLNVLSVQASRLLIACRVHEEETKVRERLIQEATQRSNYYISHNLRSRLASLPGLLALYRTRGDARSDLRQLNDLFSKIVASAQQTLSRTTDLLRAVAAHPSRFCLGEMLQELLQTSFANADEKRWHVELDSDVDVFWDRDLIESLLLELIDNARQAVIPADRKLHIKCSAATVNLSGREMIRIIVSDNGPGIPETLKPRIFEDFFSRRPGQEPGTGIGLAFVRRATIAHGGSIEENGDDTGARFVLELPRECQLREERH